MRKLRSQYVRELGMMEDLPALQINTLWNEILLYAQLGFNNLRQRNDKTTAIKNYQLPDIKETPTLDFLLFSLLPFAGVHKLGISDSNRKYLEKGREFITEGFDNLIPGYASHLIGIAASVMEQIALEKRVDITDKTARAKLFIEKLQGGNLIADFESYDRKELYELASQGRAIRVFEKIDWTVTNARKYNVPLDFLLTHDELSLLRNQAVNHPNRGLRGELLEIAEEVASGKTYRRFDLSKTDELVAFCDDNSLAQAYQNIRSAIDTLASAYRGKLAGAFGTSLPASHKRVDDLTPASTQLAESIPFNPRGIYNLPKGKSMTSNDARAILSMFQSGDLDSIITYGTPASAPSHVSSYDVDRIRKRSAAGMLAAMGGLAAVIAGILMLPNQSKPSQTSDYGKVIEIDCTTLPPLYGQSSIHGNVWEGPVLVCAPGTETAQRGDILLPMLADSGSGPSAGEKIYRVVLGDNLAHIMKRQAGITDDGQAYLEALNYAKSYGISPPYIIHPGQIITIRSR